MAMTTKEYKQAEGSKCPSCSSTNIDRMPTPTLSDGECVFHVYCDECNAEWDERFELTHYINLKKEAA